MNNYAYVGAELELFADATNWKRYYRRHLARYIRGQVLEVGAGIGGTTRVLCDGTQSSWLCLEPDPQLASTLQDKAGRREFGLVPEVRVGGLAALAPAERFDAILYIDVLEHIADDAAELSCAAGHLKPDGSLIVLAPAHAFLFSEFDAAIGHCRRYDKRMLRTVGPANLQLLELYYLDSIGMLLSLANRWLLHASNPSRAQIRLWDRLFLPCSRLADPLFGWRLGKTVIAVWKHATAAARATDR